MAGPWYAPGRVRGMVGAVVRVLDYSVLTAACRLLRVACEETGVDRVTVIVRADGRVELCGERSHGRTDGSAWTDRADLVAESAHAPPGDVLARRIAQGSVPR